MLSQLSHRCAVFFSVKFVGTSTPKKENRKWLKLGNPVFFFQKYNFAINFAHSLTVTVTTLSNVKANQVMDSKCASCWHDLSMTFIVNEILMLVVNEHEEFGIAQF